MTTLADRPHTALLVIDVQNRVMSAAHDRDRVVATIAALARRARAAGAPVIWVQHSADDLPPGSDAWQFVAELGRLESEPLVAKTYADAFEETELESVLAGLRVGHLLVSGAQTDVCIRSTLHGAIARGYDATLVSDAHTTEDLSERGAPAPGLVIAHTNLYWQHHFAPGRAGGTVPAATADFTAAS